MKTRLKFAIVLVTAPTLKVARNLARGALKERLVACVNLVPKIESHYWWQDRIERGGEVLMVCKTTAARLWEFEDFIRSHHPYETPEFVIIPIEGGSARYLSWIGSSVTSTSPSARDRRPDRRGQRQ